MNDRYLFKAKGQTDGKWHTGLLANLQENKCIIHESDRFEWICNPETLCQCTGLIDRNGNLIWENDIVRFSHEKLDFDADLDRLTFPRLGIQKEYHRNYAVEFCNTPMRYGLRFRNSSIWFMVHRMTIRMHDTEIIGNIFDNPELLEVE